MKLTENSKGILNVIQIGSQFSSMFLSFAPLLSAAGSALAIVGKFSINAVKGIYRLATSGKVAAAGIWLKNVAVTTGNGILAVYNALTSRAWWVTMAHSIATKASALWTAVCSKAQLVASAVTSLWSKRTALATLVQGGLTKALRLVKVTMMTGVIPALPGVIASTWAWTAALLANPITWIILAVVALVAAIAICWNKFAGFRAVVYTIWDTIKGFGQAIIDWMIAPFKAAGALIGGLAGAVGKVFSGDWGGAWDSLKEGFGGAADAFTKPVKEAVDTARGIGGNYRMHLTEEQAKQAEKERSKEAVSQSKKEVAKKTSQLDNKASNDIDISKFSTQFGDLNLDSPDLAGLDMNMIQGIETPRITPEITGYSATQQVGKSQTATINGMQTPDISIDALSEMMTKMNSQEANIGPLAPPETKVQVDFKPTINISGDMSKKSKDDLLALFKQYASDLAKMINEENRKQNRGNYGIPAIG